MKLLTTIPLCIAATLSAQNITVPAGAKITVVGQTGPVGATGAAGPKGDTGAPGVPGPVGTPGTSGASAGCTLGTVTGPVKVTLTPPCSFSFDSSASATTVVTPPVVVPVTTTPVPNSGSATTWYVRPDGGTRYSAANTAGQCNGKGDAAYPGSGVNQTCAFSDVRYFWTDGSYTTDSSGADGKWKWIGSGGDTYLIRGSIGSGVSYRVGQAGPNAGDSFGLHGDPYSAGAPLPPAGTAAAHTRILGENFASCSTRAAKTQLHGGFGVSNVLNLAGAQYVDAACLDITDFSACGKVGQVNSCKSGYPLDDFASNGIAFSNQTTHTTVTDVSAHGLANSGFGGPTGDGVVLTRIELLGNAGSGWNADAGNGTTGTGSLLVQGFNISWNGCAEEYPVVHALPYADCTDDQSGGYGDGFGTATVPSNPGWKAHFDNGIASYNTQDGLDALHLNGAGSSMTITNTAAFGNMGQQIKIGGAAGTAVGDTITGSAYAMKSAIPGTPVGYNSRLSDFGRAGSTAVLVTVTSGTTTTIMNNTFYTGGSLIGVEVQCTAEPCASSTGMVFTGNTTVGNPVQFPGAAGKLPVRFYFDTASSNPFGNPGSLLDSNSTTGVGDGCPITYETNATCK